MLDQLEKMELDGTDPVADSRKKRKSGAGAVDASQAASQNIEKMQTTFDKRGWAALTATLVVSLASRLRALESIAVDCFHLPTEDEATIITRMANMGKLHQAAMDAERAKRKKYTPKNGQPIHVNIFHSVMMLLAKGHLSKTAEFNATIAKMSQNMEWATPQVKYFKKVLCYDKKFSRILVALKPGTEIELAWDNWVAPFLVKHNKATQMSGVAPRSKKERDLIKALVDAKILKKETGHEDFMETGPDGSFKEPDLKGIDAAGATSVDD